MNYPQELKYTQEHEWVRIENDIAYIGITDFAQKELGDIVYVESTYKISETIEKDVVFGIVEAVKTVSDLYMPLKGELLDINSDADKTPALLNKDPYTNWIIKVKILDVSDINSLLSVDEYKALIGA